MKDHYIPCLLLAQFSVDGSLGRKARVYQFTVDGPHPETAVPAQDLAHSGDFYDHADFPDLDAAGLLEREKRAAQLIREITGGADPQTRVDEVASLVAIQSARTKALRQWGTNRFGAGISQLLSAIRSQSGLDALRRWVGQALGDCDVNALVRLGLPRDLAAIALARLGRSGIEQAANSHVLDDLMARLRVAVDQRDVVGKGVTKGQVKALHSLMAGVAANHPLMVAKWTRLESKSEPLILGDACVVAVGADGLVGWPGKFGKDWAEVYLPIGRHCAIVGLAPDVRKAPSLEAAALNRASAELSRDYIYASRCTSVEQELALRIGTREPAITDLEIEEVIGEWLKRESLDP